MGAHADYVDATVSDTMRMPLDDFLARKSTEFFCPQISTDYHRFLNIKDILIITDYYHQSIIINHRAAIGFPFGRRTLFLHSSLFIFPALGAEIIALCASNNRNSIASNNRNSVA